MDLNSVYTFINVVRAGSFTKAAQLMKMPTSTVSDRVAELEKMIGAALLIRTTRRLKLTETGEEFFKKSEASVEALLQAGAEAANEQTSPSGTLKISLPGDFPTIAMAEVIADYKKKFPQVRVETYFTNKHVDLISEGFDIAIRGAALKDSSLIARTLSKGKLILVASSGYLKSAPPLQHPKDLVNHKCIYFMGGDASQNEAVWNLQNLQGKKMRVKPLISSATSSLSMSMAQAALGQGIALVPYVFFAREQIDQKKVVQVLPDWGTEIVPVNLIYAPHRFPQPKIKEMVELLENKFKGTTC